MNISRKILSLLAVVSLIIIQPVSAWASVIYASNPVYISTSTPDTMIVSSSYMLANSAANDGTTFTDVSVSWELQEGDQIQIQWWDKFSNSMGSTTLDTSNPSSRAVSVTPPSGAYAAKLVLRTGSASGNRYFWWHSVSNTNNITVIYPDPDISIGGETGGSVPSGGTSTTVVVDNSDVVEALRDIKNQLNSLSSDVHSQFQDVIGKLGDLKNYFTTPRVPDPFDVEPLPEVSFDPTPPDISEPYQQPYTYDRPEPSVPATVDSPEPLPYAPDPQIMEHDQPLQIEQPRQKDNPLARDNPLVPDSPLPLDPVIKQDPLTPDPVIKQEPITRDAPITPDNPVARETPISPETPLTKEPVLQRDPPITPDPPLSPGG